MRISDWSSDVCSSDLVFVGAAEAASSCSLPCEGRGGPGRGAFWISANRGHPLPASPCLRRGRGQGKRDDYNEQVKFLASLVLSSLLPFAAHTQVAGTGAYPSPLEPDSEGRNPSISDTRTVGNRW